MKISQPSLWDYDAARMVSLLRNLRKTCPEIYTAWAGACRLGCTGKKKNYCIIGLFDNGDIAIEWSKEVIKLVSRDHETLKKESG